MRVINLCNLSPVNSLPACFEKILENFFFINSSGGSDISTFLVRGLNWPLVLSPPVETRQPPPEAYISIFSERE